MGLGVRTLAVFFVPYAVMSLLTMQLYENPAKQDSYYQFVTSMGNPDSVSSSDTQEVDDDRDFLDATLELLDFSASAIGHFVKSASLPQDFWQSNPVFKIIRYLILGATIPMTIAFVLECGKAVRSVLPF